MSISSKVRRTAAAAAALGLVALGGAVIPAAASGYQTELVNVDSLGQRGVGSSRFPSVHAGGTIVGFDSRAATLVPGDTNGHSDVFVRYTRLPQTIRVSVNNNGQQGNGDSLRPSLDDSARLAAFESHATNLVEGDTNGVQDVFVRGLLANPNAGTRRVSVSSAGAEANGSSATASISADGRFVAFTSVASNLVAGDTNGVGDIFVRDLGSGQTSRVSVGRRGAQGDGLSSLASISGDGRYVAFVSAAANLVKGDTNNADDVFVHDRATGRTTRVSVAEDGSQANGNSSGPSISEDGHWVAFRSDASNLVSGDTNGRSDVIVYDVTNSIPTRASASSSGAQANGDSSEAAISADGEYVAYSSDATNLVPGDTNRMDDVFRWERDTLQTERWSVASNGSQASAGLASGQPAINDAGDAIAFASDANNLFPGDTLTSLDVFLRRP
jgi:archaellum component FlaF (FlaF/FlaG flagellin family)